MDHEAERYIRTLGLEPHPEGGCYARTFEATGAEGDGPLLYTSIYFLLRNGEVSHLHRLKSDELWYFHDGGPLDVHMLFLDGTSRTECLGLGTDRGERPQVLVPAGTIFGSEPAAGSSFSLVGCMVAPGFDFADFELFTQVELLIDYPEHEGLIRRLAYRTLPE
ncbi:cupin domain-containing protein [Edaphobacillus lindanitolerans]|uniref:DUF985 domain-containing protein n=1 Tax=Edaphobacillus lindanitolerans TaxID=550447 RepID=A0A1U7PQH0_9BACI|nr:cupin domain-containing protein [Edaphobacillus lindanitolerans]SIT85695.1 hypothetical protein SAMN05428946_1861 [Edaphobacillus lindanitolerans]